MISSNRSCSANRSVKDSRWQYLLPESRGSQVILLSARGLSPRVLLRLRVRHASQTLTFALDNPKYPRSLLGPLGAFGPCAISFALAPFVFRFSFSLTLPRSSSFSFLLDTESLRLLLLTSFRALGLNKSQPTNS